MEKQLIKRKSRIDIISNILEIALNGWRANSIEMANLDKLLKLLVKKKLLKYDGETYRTTEIGKALLKSYESVKRALLE